MVRIHNKPLAMEGIVLPVRSRIFGPKDKNDFVVPGMKSGSATVGPEPGVIQAPDLSCLYVHHLDVLAVKLLARGIRAGVIDKPLTVGRPDADVGKNMAAPLTSDLLFDRVGHLKTPKIRHASGASDYRGD